MRCSQSLTSLLAFYAVTLPTATVSGAPRSVVVTEAQNGQNVQIGINDVLIVRLQAQAGSGYSWAVATVTSFLRLSQEHTEPAGRTIPAAAKFSYSPSSPSAPELSLEFRLSAPWETGQPPARTYNVKVSVSTH